jgi:hypothetical protein
LLTRLLENVDIYKRSFRNLVADETKLAEQLTPSGVADDVQLQRVPAIRSHDGGVDPDTSRPGPVDVNRVATRG